MSAFTNRSIRRQMRIIGVIVLAVFLVLCQLISYATRQLVHRNEDEYLKVAASRLHDEIELSYSRAENFCIHIGEDAAVQALMRSDYTHISSAMRGVKECLTKNMILEPMIVDISLVNDIVHYSGIYHEAELDEIRQAVSGKPFRWVGVRRRSFALSEKQGDLLTYAGDIILGTENIGTVIISLDIHSLISEQEIQKDQVFYLADSNGILYTFTDDSGVVEATYAQWKGHGYSDAMETRDYYIRSYDLTDMECSLVAVLDFANIEGGLGTIQLFSWTGVILSALFCMLFYLMVMRGIVGPLRQFHDKIQDIRQSDRKELRQNLNLKGCSEISELGDEFSGMLRDIESLNQTVLQNATDLYEMELNKQKAEFAYLRSQIDPHFLYNTLEVVRKIAIQKGSAEIAQITLDMANIFRYSTKGEDTVPLEKEISIIKSYIRIQQMRFAGKIDVYYAIADDVLSIPIMKMILQPIVENSLFHGLEPKNGSGSLFIGARRDGERLIITVKDDGVGIEADKLKALKEMIADNNANTSEHVGILNTNARLRLAYGEPYGLSVDSCEGDGTTVILTLPVNDL